MGRRGLSCPIHLIFRSAFTAKYVVDAYQFFAALAFPQHLSSASPAETIQLFRFVTTFRTEYHTNQNSPTTHMQLALRLTLPLKFVMIMLGYGDRVTQPWVLRLTENLTKRFVLGFCSFVENPFCHFC